MKKQLTDKEIDQAVGGRGQIPGLEHGEIFTCALVPDDETFRMYFGSKPNNCPSFDCIRKHPMVENSCDICVHFRPKLAE